jgi:hypothetical protein
MSHTRSASAASTSAWWALGHHPPQPLGLAGAKAGKRHRHLDHLVLEDDGAERVFEHRLQARMVVGDLEGGVGAQALQPGDVGVDRAALDRPGTDDRHLDGEIVKRRRAGPA